MKAWELYKFPGGKVGEARSLIGVYWWLYFNCCILLELRECRAINRFTGKHIVK